MCRSALTLLHSRISSPNTCACSCASIRRAASDAVRRSTLVVGLGKFKLLARVENRPPIGGVRGQRLVRPVGRALDGVVEQIEVYEVDGQLAPGQKLVEVVITEEWNDLDRSVKTA